MDALFENLLKAIAYAFNVLVHALRVSGSGRWPLANSTVTAPPLGSPGLGCQHVEIVYSYRVKGELYTGIHTEPFFLADSLTEYIERFAEGRSVVVRVKPDNPEVSVVREDDQGTLTQFQREQLTS